MKLSFQANAIQAALICAAKKDLRIYLCGVCIDVNSKRQLTVIGTNGHMMAAFNVPYESEAEPVVPGFQLIIPLEAAKAMKKAVRVTIEALPDGAYTISDGSNSVRFLSVDGCYPDYRRVMPRPDQPADKPVLFKPDYLQACNTALQTFYGSKKDRVFPLAHLNGSMGVMHSGMNDAACVIMGMRDPGLGYEGFFNNADLDQKVAA